MLPSLTYCRHHSPHKVESPGEVPSRSDRVHSYPRYVCLLVVPQEVIELFLAQVVLLAEMLEPLRPAFLRLPLLGLLQRGEHGGPAQKVHDDEQRQEQEPRVVLVDRAAAAAAPACHYVAVVRTDTCGMVLSMHLKPRREKRREKSRYSQMLRRGFQST